MRLSTNNLVSEYMQTAESMDLAESTREAKVRLFEEIERLFEYVDEFDVNKYQLYLLKTRKKVSVNSYVKMVRPIYKWAIRQGWIASDPFEGVRKFRVPLERIHVYKPCQIEAMLAVSNDIWQARILAAVTAGARRSEVLNLTLDDINFDDCEIAIQPKRDTAETWEYWPKNKKYRIVPLVPMFYNLIVSKIIPSLKGQQYLTLSEKRHWTLQRQRPLNYRRRINPDENFNKPFKRIIERANTLLPSLDRISLNRTFHDLRRTCITHWTQNPKLSPQEVQLLAGHADIKTTMEYYAAVRDDVCRRAQTSIGAAGNDPATS